MQRRIEDATTNDDFGCAIDFQGSPLGELLVQLEVDNVSMLSTKKSTPNGYLRSFVTSSLVA